MPEVQQPILILGAGINGCAIARELLLNGVSVWVVDTADIASGATSGSSRLIHGGLRYLEYGEFDLVRESLGERTRLLRLAPQFVRPLRLWIPSATRFDGLVTSVGRFFGWQWWPNKVPPRGRGVALVRAGLSLYDAYARDPLLPKHQVASVADSPIPFDRKRYRWASSYYDAQVVFPERLAVALLQDAQQLAKRGGLDFRVLTYHAATLERDTVEIASAASGVAAQHLTLRPAAIINATGAWVDQSLRRLHVDSRRLMGGTKGSHLFTFSQRLRDALGGEAIYAEAPDGRPVFITPLADAVLVGTTDEPFEGPPETAQATQKEIDYLLGAVDMVLPGVELRASDVDFHYSAVRPLPYVHASAPAAITRRHALVRHDNASVPLFSVVGGKLTTMRSLAAMTTTAVLAALGRAPTANSESRVIPGGESYPADAAAVDAACNELAQRCALPLAATKGVWRLCGTRSGDILAASSDRELLPGCELPCSLARWAIEREWAATLADLVERRLMLLYHQRLRRADLARLAQLLAEQGRLASDGVETAVAAEIQRLAQRYGKRLD